MRTALPLLLGLPLLCFGCHDGVAPPALAPTSAGGDGSGAPGEPVDLGAGSADLASLTPAVDLGLGLGANPDLLGAAHDASGGGDGGLAATSLTGLTAAFDGLDVLDVSTDQGGGLWAVTRGAVHYRTTGGATFSYDQSSGLARGWSTWTDTYYTPGTYPVTFSAVAGATAGQAIVGNIGAIADRLEVDPTTGTVLRIDNMAVEPVNVSPAELTAHQQRVVAVWHAVVDLNGAFHGTAYLGGWHGFYAFHGLMSDCGCLAFEEHQHYITATAIGGGDVRGLALTADGDLWAGDRDFVQLLPQRSQGASIGLFDEVFAVGLDVFPGVRDEVTGLGVDAQGGVWVASGQNGLAHLAPVTHAATFFTTADGLPTLKLSGLVVDDNGDVWTSGAGQLLRYRASAGRVVAYDVGANGIRAIFSDHRLGGRSLYLATDVGVKIYAGP
jgi:hypothetical protein